jgi:stress-induced morphogen
MPLPIFNSVEDVSGALRAAIATALPDAQVRVTANSPGHFEIEVVSAAFAGKSMVQQQQLVYGAIKELMAGDHAPVHAIDRLRTKTSPHPS